jgi:glycosyltransferase involved in cell wall biosynthesis
MNVGLVIYGSLSQQTGGYLYDRKLIEHLRARGDDVTVVSLPARAYAACLTDHLRLPFWRRLARAPFDVLLQDELNHPSLAWGNRWLRRRVAYPLVGIVHHLRASEPRPAWQNAAYAQVERAFLRSLDACIYNSQTTKRLCERLAGGPRASVVAVPSGRRFGQGLREALVAERAREDGPLRVLCLGSVTPRKNQQTLARAVARLPDGACHVHVVGSLRANAAYAKRLQNTLRGQGIEERATLHGALGDAGLVCLMRRCHVMALPSRFEGYGIAYVEAMRFGMPVIASRTGTPREFVQSGANGYLVAPDDAATLAALLHLLHADRAELVRLARGALAFYRAAPTWDNTTAHIASFIDRLIDPTIRRA